MDNITIVVPTIREDCIRKFLNLWKFQHKVIVIEDNPKKTFKLQNVDHYSWKEIDEELGEDTWIIPRKTDCIRSFGFYKAYKEGAEIIITLDDDCYPANDRFIREHVRSLNSYNKRWIHTTKVIKSRGVPYRNLGAQWFRMINMGFWSRNADLDAVSQLVYGNRQLEPNKMKIVPFGMYYPMCGMNLSFRSMATPMMYFLLMGKGYEYDRFGDIWCGIISKKICDHLNYTVSIGEPRVDHMRASNLWSNLRKEISGLEKNETFWEDIDNIKLKGRGISECYLEIAEQLPEGEYFKKLKEAMKIWIKILS